MTSSATIKCKTLFIATFMLFFTSGTVMGQTVDYNTLSKTELQNVIVNFELGLGTYVIGKALNAAQMAIAEKNHDYKAYSGTVKFKDGDIFVIADKTTNVVIAVYKRNKNADKNDFKTTISLLMIQYGEPTAEAHGKTIYWNYGEDGLISEELYRTVKSQGQLEKLIVLATVKFTSSENVELITDMIEMMDKKNQQGENVKKSDITSDNYVMIQSDLLTKKYIEN